MDCGSGALPFVAVNCRDDGLGEITGEPVEATMMFVASVPVFPCTAIVINPDSPAGHAAVIDVLLHDDTASVWPLVEPAGVATTLQPLHCAPRVAPVIVIVDAGATIFAAPLASGPTEMMVASILQRAAAK